MRREVRRLGGKPIVIRGEFIVCALAVLIAFLLIRSVRQGAAPIFRTAQPAASIPIEAGDHPLYVR